MVNGKNGGRELGMAYFKALCDAEPELMKIATPSKSLDLPDEVWHRLRTERPTMNCGRLSFAF
jgi:hypothetical protein